MKTLNFILLPALLYVFSHSLQAATIFVDQKLSTNCSGSYNVGSNNCTGTAGSAYKKIQDAINNSSVGDVIYMRGDTYRNISINIPQTKNGNAWTKGGFSTLMSYPGEWAIIDATGLTSTAAETNDAVIYGYKGFDTGSDSKYTEYWKFSNFELLGGGSGVHMKMRHVKWYYMYIHNNGRAGGIQLQSGILSVNPQYSEIKYSYFKDNIDSSNPNFNMAHILFDGDYRDESPLNGESFLENGSTHSNEIAYNYFEQTGSNKGKPHIAIRQKNQQRFGYNNRNPKGAEMMGYKDWGDDVHHNIVIGSAESIGMGQDFLQVHNNITDSTINIGRWGDNPTTYNAVIYNNTVKFDWSLGNTANAFVTSSGLREGGSKLLNFYDNGGQQTVHPHIGFYNNIADGNSGSYRDVPFSFNIDMPRNTSNPNRDYFDLIVENNLIHNNSAKQVRGSTDIMVGRQNDASYNSSCERQEKLLSEFDSCSDSWRSLAGGTVANWKNSSSGLYLNSGSTGAQQYITNFSFKVGGAKTICDGGRSGNHPYLAGVSLPGYIGATNPNDFAWVSGVLTDVKSPTWLRNQTGSAPNWVEKSGGQSGVCKAPPKPPIT